MRSVGLFFLAPMALWPVSALAYIDPGTGSILIQGVIAAIAAIGVTLKLYWHRFIALFRRKPVDRTELERSNANEGEKP